MSGENEHLQVSIWRGKRQGRFVDYQVPARTNQTVLDVVTWVQRHREPSLAYRFACRVGVCGSCAMTVNGRPRWTCRTHVRKVAGDGRLRIEPLRNLPRIKDLACDMAPFFDKWQRAGGRFKGGATRAEPMALVDPSSPQRRAADAAIECINCAVCYSACDTVSLESGLSRPCGAQPRVDSWSTMSAIRRARTPLSPPRRAPVAVMPATATEAASSTVRWSWNRRQSIAGLKRRTLDAFSGTAR